MFNKIISIIDSECSGDKIQFCLDTRIKRNMLYSLLSGRNKNPGINVIIKIKQAYPDINLNWLLYNDLEKYIPPKNNYKNLIKEIDKKNALIDYLKTLT